MADRTLQANFSANTAGFTQGTNVLRQRLLELNTNMEQTRQAVRNANQQVREYQKELRQLQQATQNGNTATSEQRSRMQELRDRIAQTTSQLGTLRTAEQDLRGQIRNTNEALNNQQTALESVTSGASTMGQVLKANPYLTVASAILALVGGIAAFIGATNNATESLDDMRQKAEEFNNTAKQSDQAAKEVRDLADEYTNICEAADDTEEAKSRLKEIQDILIDTYGVEAEKIDLVNGKYEDQIKILDQLIDKKSEDAVIQARAAMNTIKVSEQQESSFIVDKYKDGIEDSDAIKKFAGYMADYLGDGVAETGMGDGTEFYFTKGTSYEKRYDISRDIIQKLFNDADAYAAAGDYENEKATRLIIEQIMPYYNENKEMFDSYQDAQDIVDYYTTGDGSNNGSNDGGVFTPGAWIGKEYAEKAKRDEAARIKATGVDWSDYNSVKKYYQYLRDTEQITDAQMYDFLEQYANKLLSPNSEEWRTATAEIYKGRKTASGSSGSTKDPNEEAYNSDKEYLKWRLDMGYITEEEYYSQLQQLRDKYLEENSKAWRSATLEIHKYQVKKDKERFDTLKTEYDAALSALDELDKQHERDKEDADYDKQLAEIDKQLKYDRLDDYSRQQLEQKRQEVLDDREETLRERSIEDLKTELETVYTMAKDAYEQGTADLGAALTVASQVFSAVGTGASQLASTVSTVNNNNVNLTLGAVSYTADQIAAAVVKALTSAI